MYTATSTNPPESVAGQCQSPPDLPKEDLITWLKKNGISEKDCTILRGI